MKSKEVSRRSFLKKMGTAAIAVPAAPLMSIGEARGEGASVAPFPMIQNGAARKRNILFIGTDDCCNRLGVYGGPVKTPNLDRFAKSAVRFDRAYCQYPLCTPGRTALMTGLAPDTTKVYDLSTHFREALPDLVTLPQAFLKNGYFTSRAGKIYHYGNPTQIGTAGLDDPPSWNATVNPAGVDHVNEEPMLTAYTPRAWNPAFVPDRGVRGQGPAREQRHSPGSWFGMGNPIGAQVAGDGGWGATIAFYESKSSQELHTDYMVADAVIDTLEKRRMQPDQPWFVSAGFYKPHVPWIAPSEYFDMYPLSEVEVTPFNAGELKIAPHWAYTSMQANHGMTTEQCRNAIRAYYACASFLDANIGRILDALEKLGMAENTTVLLWADHGYQLGEHGQWEKMTLFEPSARIPLMIGGAGVAAKGQGCPRTVEQMDIYPTLVELCGLQGAPSNLHGKSLVPLLSDPNAAWDRPAISQVYSGAFEERRGGNEPPSGVMGYSLRTERYRYTFWREGSEGEELYDYETDPHGMRNLANDSSSSELKNTLRASLEKICRERGMANAPGALA
jgi:uncharacterized sulfatase